MTLENIFYDSIREEYSGSSGRLKEWLSSTGDSKRSYQHRFNHTFHPVIEFKIKVEYPLGAMVRLKCEPFNESPFRMVTNYNISMHGVVYICSYSGGTTSHYGYELEADDRVERQFGFTTIVGEEKK